jgi:peptidoglycan/xylan/chitin deacetylase (PgdA/CDA1 family)
MRRPPIALCLTAALLVAGAARADAVAFIYHRFGEAQYPTTSVTLAQFDAHLALLARERYSVWPLERIVATLEERRELPPKVVAISIDDGFESIYSGAYPRLKARGFPFTVFVNTDAIDEGRSGYLTWAQVKEMAAHGARFANHGASHDQAWKRRPGEDQARWTARLRADVVRCQQRLQAELGPDTNESPRLYAFPYGEYDAATAEVIAQMRYVAFGQQSGAIARLGAPALPRFPMSERYADEGEFAQKVRARALPVEVVAPRDPLIARGAAPVLRLRFADAAWRDRVACYYGGERIRVTWQPEGRELAAVAGAPLGPGRHRYNCTARDAAGDWYWFSQPWLVE